MAETIETAGDAMSRLCCSSKTIIPVMHPEIASRFEKLELRRVALIERVRAMAADKQTAAPAPKEWSPAQVVMHMALAEKFDLDIFRKNSPEALKGKPLKHTFIFKNVMSNMTNAKKSPTLKAMTPNVDVQLDQAAKAWEDVRKGIAGCLEKVDGPGAPMTKNFLFGTLSASDWLGLFEAHTHYHETRLPQ